MIQVFNNPRAKMSLVWRFVVIALLVFYALSAASVPSSVQAVRDLTLLRDRMTRTTTGQKSGHEITFRITTALSANTTSTVKITFPSGFANLSELTPSLITIGSGTISSVFPYSFTMDPQFPQGVTASSSVAGQSVLIDFKTGPAIMAANTAIVIGLATSTAGQTGSPSAGPKNPTADGSYTITVKTQTSSGTVIDAEEVQVAIHAAITITAELPTPPNI